MNFGGSLPGLRGWGLTILRVIVGIVFLLHGGQKVFGYGLAGTAGAFGQMGIPLAGFTAPLVAFVELLGGICLVLGLFTRVAALLIGIDMLGAILLVHLKGGFFLPHGYEYALTLLAVNATLFIEGAGQAALDHMLFRGSASAGELRVRAGGA